MLGRKLISKAVFVMGFMICSYPLASSIIEGFYQKDALSSYMQEVNSTDNSILEEAYKKSEEYNTVLFNQRNPTISQGGSSILSEDSYNELLNIGNGVMGSIEIPKISVNLPIYHGTSDEVLSVGVGHVYGSSLPVGGTNTRSILTGHRGLPNAKLFTRLDEIVEGDLFFVRVLNKTLAYRVYDIMVINPDDTDSVDLIDGKDLVSLITCTPYGLNTHRLVVTGERVPYEPEVHENIKKETMSNRELLFAGIPFIFVGVVIILKVNEYRKNKKKGDIDKDEVKKD